MENSQNSNCCSQNQTANSSCCPPTVPVPAPEKNKKEYKKSLGLIILGLAFVLAISSAFRTAIGSKDGLSSLLPSIEDFEWMETDEEVVYVLLKGDDENQNKQLSKQVDAVVMELKDTEDSVEYYELNPSHQHYSSFKEKTSVEETPSVVVLGRGGNISLLDSESVNSLKLFRAYVSATTPIASCNPAACKSSKTCSPEQKARCAAKKLN